MNEEFALIASVIEYYYDNYIQKLPDSYKEEKIKILKNLFNYKDIPFTSRFKLEIK